MALSQRPETNDRNLEALDSSVDYQRDPKRDPKLDPPFGAIACCAGDCTVTHAARQNSGILRTRLATRTEKCFETASTSACQSVLRSPRYEVCISF